MQYMLWIAVLTICFCVACSESAVLRHISSIFRPFPPHTHKRLQKLKVLSSPEQWLAIYSAKTDKLRTIMNFSESASNVKARKLYVETLLRFVTGLVYGPEEVSAVPILGTSVVNGAPVDDEQKFEGLVWTGYGTTMVGVHRLRNIYNLLSTIFAEDVHGGFLEAGVWRGGASVFARGIMRIHGEGARRLYVCDSFRGLPPSIMQEDISVGSWDHTRYTEVSEEDVAMNFVEMGVADAYIVFVKGFFNSSMPALRRHILNTHASPANAFSILRLDADMYESTVDVLYHLYDFLSVGGYVIMDDWFGGFASRRACEDFFSVHKIQPQIVKIDTLSVFWKKEEHITVQYWRYEKKLFHES